MTKRVTSENSLFNVYPDLAAEWHPTKNGTLVPSCVTAGSSKKVWWQCSKGHEWEARIDSRSLSGTGCPYCAGQKAVTEKAVSKVEDKAPANTESEEPHPTVIQLPLRHVVNH